MLARADILAVVDEIEARSPGFFEANMLAVDGDAVALALQDALPTSAGEDLEGLVRVVSGAWQSRGVRWEARPGSPDPIAEEMLRGIRDTMRRDLPPPAEPTAVVDAKALLLTEYETIEDSAGTPRCFVRRGGTHPLLVLNALGLPIGMWARFLGGEHDHQVIVPVLASCDPIDGAMTETSSAPQLAGALRDLLEELALPEVDTLAWCNAGRVGTELLRLAPHLVGKLVLLSPTFRGGITRSDRTSSYEDNLDKLFSLVASRPSRAAQVSTMLRLPRPVPAWPALADRPAERAQLLFGMPRKQFDAELITPMATADSLVHYVQRTYLDEASAAKMPSGLPGERVTLIQGSDDAIVDNLQAREWLADHAEGFACYEVSGAGHYIHDLQCRYLLHLLDRVLGNAHEAPLPARVSAIATVAP